MLFREQQPVGRLEVRDSDGKVLAVVRPGDDCQFDLRSAPIVQHYDDLEKFRSETLQRSFEVMQNNPMFQQFFGATGQHLAFGVNTAYQAANTVSDLENGPLAPVVGLNQQVQTKGASLQTLIDWSASLKNPAPANFPQALRPASPQSAIRYLLLAGMAPSAARVMSSCGCDSQLQDLVTARALRPTAGPPECNAPLEPAFTHGGVIPSTIEMKPVGPARRPGHLHCALVHAGNQAAGK